MRDLVDRLGCYPLVIAQIAQSIRMNPAETIQSILDSMAEVDYSRMNPNKRYKETLNTVLDRLLPQLPGLPLKWLHVCSHLNPARISCSYIEIWLRLYHELGIEASKQRARQILRILVNRGWLRFDTSGQTLSIHRLFQEILKRKDKKSSYEEACHLLLKLWDQIDFDDIRDWRKIYSTAEDLYAHSVLLMADPKFKTLPPKDQAKFYAKTGDTKYIQGKYQEALEKHEQALTLRQKSLEPNHPDIAGSLNSIGNYLASQGKYQEAQKEHEQALAIRKKSLEPNHPDIAMSLNNIGVCLDFQDKTKEAMEKYEQALGIRQKSLDPNHPDIATNLDNVGSCLYSQSKTKEALEKHEQALGIRQKSLDPNHPDIALSLNNIGNCLYSQGKIKKALEKNEQALGIRQKSLEPNHPDIAMSLNNIGSCLNFQDKYREAAEHFHKAYKIAITSLGDDHPSTQRYLKNCKKAEKKAFCSIQ